MTTFESMLIDKGFIKHILNCRTMKYELADKHIMSTMVNLDHRYIHKSDKTLLDKIKQGKSIMDNDFTLDDRKGIVCFGFNEKGKPPTLINPRPKISVKREREINGEKQMVIEDQQSDDSMNLVLSKENPEEIFKALFDDSIVFNYNLTNKTLKN